MACAACAGPRARNYYTMTYPQPPPVIAQPHDLVLRVKAVNVRDSYRRPELAYRHDVHELRYHSDRRWSEPADRMITDLLRSHVASAGLVRSVTADIGQSMPDYSLMAELEALETLVAGDRSFARLAMSLKLVRSKDDRPVWRWRFDDRREIGEASARGAVRVMSGLLSKHLGEALADMGRYLADPGGYRPPAPLATEGADSELAAGDPTADVIVPTSDGGLADHPQALTDDTAMPVGFGAVLVPAVTEGAREPPVAMYRDGELAGEGSTGGRIIVPPGEYEVRFGSGVLTQQISLLARVEEGKTTVLPVSWAGLSVDVVDPQFVPFRGTYELISMESREDYGVGFGADALLGESTRAWVLRPGLYKIVRAGGTYRDRTDFATVRLSAGEVAKFTLVLDEATGEFVGAGEVDPAELPAADQRWIARTVVGGSVEFNRTNAVAEVEGWSLAYTLFLDSSLRYQHGQQLWVSRLEIEESQARDPDTKAFENERDRLFTHSIYTYILVPWFGPYARVRVDSALLPRHREVATQDAAGDPVTRDVLLRDTLAPLDLREGVGGNFRVLRRREVDLDLRLGLGARQFLARGLREVDDGGAVFDVEDDLVDGVDAAIVGQARLTRWVTLSTEMDGIFPFGELEKPRFTWRSQANLRLSSFASLAYRLNVTGDPNLGLDDDIQTEHDVQLRFSVTIF